ncbi:MAG: tetratricopeptide repeat protein [Acidobacteriota bacterium]|nr:tetratricopeptide repeat protein [Acidobacteriota bacterium]
MSDRLTRKEIKQKDQFLSAMEGGLDYGRSHLRTIGLAVAAVVAVILIAAVVVWFLRHRDAQASLALDDALKAFNAPVAESSAVPEEAQDELTFPTEEARRERARELFLEVQDSYGGTEPAALANIFLADLAVEEGDLARAQELWQAFLDDHERDLLAVQVRLNLLSAKRDAGDQEGVVEELQAMLDSDETPLPEDVILFELAQTLEELSRDDEALGYYQRILDEYPSSQYRGEAQQKTQELGGAAA